MRAWMLAGVMAFVCVDAARSAPVTAVYDFNATFASGPNPTISGSISLSYDTSASAQATVNSFVSQQLGNYTPVFADYGNSLIEFGNNRTMSGGYNAFAGTNQFFGFFSVDGSGDPTGSSVLYYSHVGEPTYYTSRSVAVTREAMPVPEPASLALVGLGVAGVAVARRRRVG